MGSEANKPTGKPPAKKPVAAATGKPPVKPGTKSPPATGAKPAAKPNTTSDAIIRGNAATASAGQKRETYGDKSGAALAPIDYGRFAGDRTLHDKLPCKVTVVSPRNIYEHAHTFVFRPLPALDPDVWNNDSSLAPMPYRTSQSPYDISPFMRRFDAAVALGYEDSRVTFLMSNALDPEYSLQRSQNPYRILYSAIKKAANKSGSRFATHPQFSQLLDGTATSRAIMPTPSNLYMAQGLVYQRPEERKSGIVDPMGRAPLGLLEDHPLHVIQLMGTQGESIYQGLVKVKDGADPGDTNWEQCMSAGDPVARRSGRFISIYNHMQNIRWPSPEQQLEIAKTSKTFIVEGKEFGRGVSYSARFDRILHLDGQPVMGVTAALSPEAWQIAMSKLLFWDQLYWVGTPEEQAIMIARALKNFREVVEFGWSATPFWQLKEVQAAFKGVKQIPLTGDISQAQPASVGGSAQAASTVVPHEEDYAEVEDEAEVDADAAEDAEYDSADVHEDDDPNYEEEDVAEDAEAEAEAEAEAVEEEEEAAEGDEEVGSDEEDPDYEPPADEEAVGEEPGEDEDGEYEPPADEEAAEGDEEYDPDTLEVEVDADVEVEVDEAGAEPEVTPEEEAAVLAASQRTQQRAQAPPSAKPKQPAAAAAAQAVANAKKPVAAKPAATKPAPAKPKPASAPASRPAPSKPPAPASRPARPPGPAK